MVVGNKKDLLTSEEVESVLKSIPLNIDLVTSAKEDDNVEDAFMSLAMQSLNK